MTQADSKTQLRHGRLVMIDVLRGLAVCMVMIRHLAFNVTGVGDTASPSIQQYPGDWFNSIASYGEYGVHLFLALSGFCIHFRWAKDGQGTIPFFSFWKRRLIRLYPPFILALCVCTAALFVLHGVIHRAFPGGPVGSWFGYTSTSQFMIDLAVLLTLTQNLNGASHRIGNGPFWSLALEEQLYLLYFPFLWLRRNYGWGIAITISLILTLVWRLLGTICFESVPQFWFVTAPAFWISWCLGALAAEHYTGLTRVPLFLSSPFTLGIAVIAAIGWRHGADTSIGLAAVFSTIGLDLFVGFVCFQIVLFAIRIEPLIQSTLSNHNWGSSAITATAWMGTCSYSIYLLHDITFTAVKQVCVSLGLPLPLILVIRLASGIIAGWIFYLVVERFFHDKSRESQRRTKDATIRYNSLWLFASRILDRVKL